MELKVTKVLALLVVGLFAPHLRAQISMSTATYAENFDSLSISGVNGWTNNETIFGWYGSRTASPTEVTNYTAGDGSSTTGAFYSFGSSGSGDRALGTLASGTPGTFAFGVRFTNDTGFARSNLIVSYTGEQWRVGSQSPHTLAFSYRTGATLTNADARNNFDWIDVPALEFTTPNTNMTQALNGNAATNRVTLSNTLPGLILAVGDELFLRWRDVDDVGFDNGLAVDDLTVSFGVAVSNAPPLPVSTNGTLSVVTYNLKGNFASDWTTNALQVQAIARQLWHLNPDIIALNEIPNGLRHEMTNWMKAFFPGHYLAVSPGTDGALRNGVISRYSITRSNSWLTRVGLTNYGVADVFTRDLFEAEIAVPGFPQPLHVFVAHLKSGTSDADEAARRAAEALCISNFFTTNLLAFTPLHPYLLAGDMNEDIAVPATGSQQPIQKLLDGTGLRLTTPVNPVTQQRFTHSIQSSNGPSRRYDYIFPNGLLFAHLQSAQVFRSDVVSPLPPGLNSTDSATGSDHLPVQMIFNHPFTQPFRITSMTRSNTSVTLQWEAVAGQSYTVESATSLGETNVWTLRGQNILATNSLLTWTTNGVWEKEFFRVTPTP